MAGPARVCPKCKAEYGEDVLFCPKDGAPLTSPRSKTALTDEDPYLGLTIAEQFRVEQLVGIGAMGRVYRAHQRGIDRQVAIKILHRELLRKPSVSTRFQREAKVASLILHPNVVQVLMIGELEKTRPDVGGEAYLVMEYLDGLSLRSALASARDALPLPRALHIALQVCDAVGEAHAQHVVHRDLKPENVMLVRRGDDRDFVKVLDFGVARADWGDGALATQAGVIFGTARYISPEVAQGEPATAASDVYSITTLLFECLAGRTPFDAESSVAILVKQSAEAPPDLRSLPRASYVPEPIARLVAQNLAKDPKARAPNARELGRALVEAARLGGIRADDLVARSTLLREGRSATVMTSMERTRALDLGADLAAKLAGKSRPGETALVTPEDPPPDAPRAPEAARPSPAPSSLDPTGPSAPADEGPREPSRPSQVDATLADVPASEVARRGSSASLDPTGTDPELPHEPRPPPGRRVLVITLCFAAGVVLALAAAFRLGVFEEPAPGVEAFARRARAALAANAFTQPPGENVRDLTDAALREWPGDPTILELRRDAANKLVVAAQVAAPDDPAEARRLAALALELDPASPDAQRLLTRGEAPQVPAAVSAATSASASARAPRPGGPPRAPASASAAPPTPSSSAEGDGEDGVPDPAKPGGRWL